MRYCAVALSFGLAFPFPAAAWAARAAPAAEETPESVRRYQAGMDAYARGDAASALASFREVRRLDPGNRSALAAVRRLENEGAARPPQRRPAAERAGAFDRFFLVSIPRWFYFERTLGDSLRDVGALAALNARVAQLLGERKVALAQNRPFRKERQLRELLRRAPVVTQRHGEA